MKSFVKKYLISLISVSVATSSVANASVNDDKTYT